MEKLNYTFSHLTNNYDEYRLEISSALNSFFEKIESNQKSLCDIFLLLNSAEIYEKISSGNSKFHMFKLEPLFSIDDVYFYTNLSQICSNHLKFNNDDMGHFFVMQLQMFAYLKFFESENILRFFYNSCCKVLNNQPYDWNYTLPEISKLNVIDRSLKQLKIKNLEIYSVLKHIFKRDIRNFIGHSKTKRIFDEFKNTENVYYFKGEAISNIQGWNNFFSYFLIFVDVLIEKSEEVHINIIKTSPKLDLVYHHENRISYSEVNYNNQSKYWNLNSNSFCVT